MTEGREGGYPMFTTIPVATLAGLTDPHIGDSVLKTVVLFTYSPTVGDCIEDKEVPNIQRFESAPSENLERR